MVIVELYAFVVDAKADCFVHWRDYFFDVVWLARFAEEFA